jgi:hypothetical protein
MSRISDKDKSVFSEAEKTITDNFTSEELLRISAMSMELRNILDAALKRQQDSFVNKY